MKTGLALMVLAIAVASASAGQPVPFELARLAEKAGMAGPVTAWCRGEFRSGRSGDFAAAVTLAGGVGQYLVLAADGNLTELAPYSGKPDLSCYSRRSALELNRTLGRSETVAGQLTPRWNTTVICGFVDGTSAVCWQYSPAARAFVQVGGWTT